MDEQSNSNLSDAPNLIFLRFFYDFYTNIIKATEFYSTIYNYDLKIGRRSKCWELVYLTLTFSVTFLLPNRLTNSRESQ